MAKKLAIVTLALLVFAAAFFLRESQRQSSAPDTAANDQPAAVEAVEQTLPRLVDLGSTQCIPCKKMAPILETLAEEYRGSFAVEFIDVRRNPDAGQEWGIRLIPTQVFLDADGEELFRHEGFMGKKTILAKWQELGFTPRPLQPDTDS